MRIAMLGLLLTGLAIAAADEKPSPEVEKLIKLLKSTSVDSQMTALKKLSTMGDAAKPALKPIIDAYTTTKNSVLQKKALETVQTIRAETHKLALELLKENDEARLDALNKLRDWEEVDQKPLASLVVLTANRERLRTSGESITMDVYFETIAKLYGEEKEAKTLFLEAITLTPGKPRGYSARRAAMEQVASMMIDKKLLYKALASALVERDSEIREKCCQRLSELGAIAKPSLTILRTMSKNDPDEDVRMAAAQAVKFIETAK